VTARRWSERASKIDGNVRAVQRSVPVSGIGVVSPFGTSADEFRDRLLAGETAIRRIRGFDVSACRTVLAGEIQNFEPTAWVAAMKLRRLDRTGVYALAATRQAYQDAGLPPATEGDDTTGVAIGTWTAGGQSTQQFLDALFRGGPSGAPALLFDSTVGNSAAGLTGLEYRLRGPNVTVSHKEASGLAAIVGAVDLLREERAVAMVTGGVDALFETFFKAHDRFRVMSPDSEPSHRIAPFEMERHGFVMGEGAYIFRLGGASAPHGEILGVSASSASVPVNAWPACAEPLSRTMRMAMEDAGVAPQDISVVYASANATSLDDSEAKAITEVFGDAPMVTSIKGALGECGASGSASCAAAFLCGAAGQVPPIVGLSRPAAAASRLRLVRKAASLAGPLALVNSFASGGALFSAVLRVGS
jgi:3-oxoacyl-[acyl-carrier-protein] synthase II